MSPKFHLCGCCGSTLTLLLNIQESLLDLPALVLEEIAKHLPPRDLASCMLCCTTLRNLLHPRQSAVIRARSLGRRWVLRACSRALFNDVAMRVATGIDAFEGSETVPNWVPWTARALIAHSLTTFRAWPRVKNVFDASNSESFYLGPFFYVCRLAQSRGFNIIVGSLERVWKQAVVQTYGAGYMCPATVFQAAEMPDLDFTPFEEFGNRFFPGLLGPKFLPVAAAMRENGMVRAQVFWGAVNLLRSEVMCVIMEVAFADCLNARMYGFWTPQALHQVDFGTHLGSYFMSFLNAVA